MIASKLLICGTVLAGSVIASAGLPRDRSAPPQADRPASPPRVTVDALGPVLCAVPPIVTVDVSQPATLVTVKAEHFGSDATIRLVSLLHVVTFAPTSIDTLGPTTLRFNAAALQDGDYQVYVRSAEGRRSNTLAMTVRHK